MLAKIEMDIIIVLISFMFICVMHSIMGCSSEHSSTTVVNQTTEVTDITSIEEADPTVVDVNTCHKHLCEKHDHFNCR